MRPPRLRFRIRTLVLLVALIAIAMTEYRVYQDGLDAHLWLLKIHCGNVRVRQSAAREIRDVVDRSFFSSLWHNRVGSGRTPAFAEQHRRFLERRSALLLPALVDLSSDPDPGCRVEGLKSLAGLAVYHGSDSVKGEALRCVFTASRDGDERVRIAALGSFFGLVPSDASIVLNRFREALRDPSIELREAAAVQLGYLGLDHPQAVAPILMSVISSEDDPGVRVIAVQSIGLFGVDDRGYSRGQCPDVVPALLAASRDPEVKIRQKAVSVLSLTRGRLPTGLITSRWALRKPAILPVLGAALTDADEPTREGAALALFALGRRESAIIDIIERVANDADRRPKSDFEWALWRWNQELQVLNAFALTP